MSYSYLHHDLYTNMSNVAWVITNKQTKKPCMGLIIGDWQNVVYTQFKYQTEKMFPKTVNIGKSCEIILHENNIYSICV